jgi:LysR family transcriptional regulator, hydrogen peroxide-inducible genes activator
MELHQLRYFVAVAECGNFSRAAEACGVSQPSLSQQVQKLEKRLNQRLLDRLGRRAVPTDAGRLLLERARGILATVEDTERRLKEFDHLDGGRLAVGAIPTIAPYLLPSLLDEFVRTHPGVELSVREDLTAHLIAAVGQGEIDLAVLALPIADDRLAVQPLFSEPLLLTLPEGHRLARRRRIALDELRAERIIVLSEMHCLGEQVLSFCQETGCTRLTCRGAQLSTIQALIALGHGVSLLPAMAGERDRGSGRVYRELDPAGPRRTVGVVWNRHRHHSRAAEQFLARLRRLPQARRSGA